MHRPFAALLLAVATITLSAQVPSVWFDRGVGAGGAFYSPSINPANDSEFFVASDMSGLYHTTNFGNSYSTVDALQVQAGHDSAVRFTNNPLIAYTVTYTGGNNALPAKTVDGGKTWNVLSGNPIPDDDVYSLWVDYNNPNHVVLAGYSDLYFSANGGTSFSAIPAAVDTGNGVLICGAFFDGNNIYLGTNTGLLVSTNGGTSFANAGTPGIAAGELMFAFTGAKVGGTMRFFCLTGASSYPGYDLGDYYQNYRNIYSLDNATGSWTAHSTGIDASKDFLMSVAMAQNDLNTVYAAGGSDAGVPVVFKTTNSGASWANTFLTGNNQNINTGWSGTGGDRGWGYGEVVFGLTVAPNNSAKALITDYGFVHRTSDGASTWQQAYVSPADQHAVNTTAISGGSYHSIGLENTSAWQVIWGDATHLFAGFSDIKGIRSSDAGQTWTLGNSGDDANTMYRIVQHPTSHALYAATSDIHDMYQSTRLADSPLNNTDANGKVLVSTNNGAAWTTIHSFGHPVFWLCLDPNNSNRMYASVIHSTAGGIFVTNDLQDGAASVWTKLANPPRTEGHPASIIVLNDGKVVCTYSGHRTTAFTASSGVFLYDPTTTTWTDVSAAGMDYWTKDVVLDPADASQNTWYVGVFSGWGGPPNGLGGLYRTTDRGAHWTRVNSLDRVTSVTFDPVHSGQAFLTTETDGLWHSANLRATSPVFTRVDSYPFRQPERVFFNPYDPGQVWVTSFGHALMVGYSDIATLGADFNSDGKADLLWQNTSTGERYVWLMNGPAFASGVSLGIVSTDWRIAATADFNGDGQTDIVWENTSTGERYLWLMNGTSYVSSVFLGEVPTAWSIAGAGDFNADGSVDLVWQNTATGERVLWLMNGTSYSSSVYLGVIPAAWTIAGSGDFNLDGNTDILWQNTSTGERLLWLMNGTHYASTVSLGVVATTWSIAGTGDFNGDGWCDIVWQNTATGERFVWLMNGTTFASGVSLGTMPIAWSIRD
jgi:hypothetical protein